MTELGDLLTQSVLMIRSQFRITSVSQFLRLHYLSVTNDWREKLSENNLKFS